MKKIIVLSFLISIYFSSLNAQTLYVDINKGKVWATGGVSDPFTSLEDAILAASKFKGDESVKIKLYPGLYTISKVLAIRTAKNETDTAEFCIEAMVMPDDSTWQPGKMPVIQSVLMITLKALSRIA